MSAAKLTMVLMMAHGISLAHAAEQLQKVPASSITCTKDADGKQGAHTYGIQLNGKNVWGPFTEWDNWQDETDTMTHHQNYELVTNACILSKQAAGADGFVFVNQSGLVFDNADHPGDFKQVPAKNITCVKDADAKLGTHTYGVRLKGVDVWGPFTEWDNWQDETETMEHHFSFEKAVSACQLAVQTAGNNGVVYMDNSGTVLTQAAFDKNKLEKFAEESGHKAFDACVADSGHHFFTPSRCFKEEKLATEAVLATGIAQ